MRYARDYDPSDEAARYCLSRERFLINFRRDGKRAIDKPDLFDLV